MHSVIGEAQFLALAVQPEQAQTCSEGPSDPPTKRQKSAMEMMFADTFSNGSTDEANSSVSPLRIVKKEVSMYQEEDLVALDSIPLIWWKLNECKYPYLSRLARRILVIQATSVCSERVFSTAGDVVTAKRSRLSAENINSIIFVNKNHHLISHIDALLM